MSISRILLKLRNVWSRTFPPWPWPGGRALCRYDTIGLDARRWISRARFAGCRGWRRSSPAGPAAAGRAASADHPECPPPEAAAARARAAIAALESVPPADGGESADAGARLRGRLVLPGFGRCRGGQAGGGVGPGKRQRSAATRPGLRLVPGRAQPGAIQSAGRQDCARHRAEPPRHGRGSGTVTAAGRSRSCGARGGYARARDDRRSEPLVARGNRPRHRCAAARPSGGTMPTR